MNNPESNTKSILSMQRFKDFLLWLDIIFIWNNEIESNKTI